MAGFPEHRDILPKSKCSESGRNPSPAGAEEGHGAGERSVVIVVPAVVTVVAVAAISSVAAVPVGTTPVISIVAPPTVVSGKLGQQIADAIHAAIQVRPGVDAVQDVPDLPVGPHQLLKVAFRAAGVVPTALHLRVELIGLLIQLAACGQHPRLPTVRTAVVALGLAADGIRRLLDLVRQGGDAPGVVAVVIPVVIA